MIYICGIDSKDFPEVSASRILKHFEDHGYVEFDSETTGLFPHTCALKCFQLGDHENQFVIGPQELPKFKQFLETKELVMHNAKFDLQFLYKQDVWPRKIYDTMVVEAVLYCGIKTHRKSLKEVLSNRLGITMDKSEREGIEYKKMTKEVIEYSANDVKYLGLIRKSQKKEIRQKDLDVVVRLENDYVRCLAYIEFCGFYLDKEKWLKKMANDQKQLEEAEKSLKQYILDNGLKKYIEPQLSLFSEERELSINWDSPKQVIPFFKDLGIDTSFVEKGETKDSVGADVLEKYSKSHPIVKTYLNYKELQKTVGTYGEGFISQINPVTKRIHTNFTQILDTGRISSGGNGTVNMQNIPAEESTRGCFVAEPGNVLVVADYNSQENVVLANKSLDKGLLEFYDKGLSDIHSYNASKIFWELANLPFEEIKEKHSDKRKLAKVGCFAVSYGGVGTTVASRLNISKEEGDRFYDAFFAAFPDLKEYFDGCERQALRDGYILIDDVTKRKSFIYGFDRLKEMEAKMDKRFWDTYKVLKKDTSSPKYQEYKQTIKDYFQIKGEITRKSYNFPIQGTSASCTKIASILLFNWILDNNYRNIVKFANVVHDEIILECPKALSETVKDVLEKFMKQGGSYFCKRVPLTAKGVISEHWTH